MSLVSVIKNIEQRPISDFNLYGIIPDTVKLVVYHELLKYRNMEQLLGTENVFVLLMESNYNVGHFVSITYHQSDNVLEWFDPYGMTHDNLIKKLDYYHNGQYYFNMLLHDFISRTQCKFVINRTKYQSLKNNSQTCGRWTGFRILFGNRLSVFHNAMIEMKKVYPIPFDDMIVILTMLATLNH